MDVFFTDIDMGKEVIPHKPVVTPGMILRQSYIFIHIKGNDILKRNLSLFIEPYQFLIGQEGAGTSRQAHDKGPVLTGTEGINPAYDVAGSPSADFFGIFMNQ
jgi:hypothetical protein